MDHSFVETSPSFRTTETKISKIESEGEPTRVCLRRTLFPSQTRSDRMHSIIRPSTSTCCLRNTAWAAFGIALLSVVTLLNLGCRIQRNAIQDPVSAQVAEDNSAWAAPYFVSHRPRRVLILHSGREQPLKEFPRQLAEAVAAECRYQRLFEVIVPYRLECATSIDEIQRGIFLEHELVRLAKQHNADAILIFRVNEFRFHSPMQVSATFAMIDAREAIMTYSQDEVWNLGEQTTFANFESFLCARSGGADESLLVRPDSVSPKFRGIYRLGCRFDDEAGRAIVDDWRKPDGCMTPSVEPGAEFTARQN